MVETGHPLEVIDVDAVVEAVQNRGLVPVVERAPSGARDVVGDLLAAGWSVDEVADRDLPTRALREPLPRTHQVIDQIHRVQGKQRSADRVRVGAQDDPTDPLVDPALDGLKQYRILIDPDLRVHPRVWTRDEHAGLVRDDTNRTVLDTVDDDLRRVGLAVADENHPARNSTHLLLDPHEHTTPDELMDPISITHLHVLLTHGSLPHGSYGMMS